MTDSMAPRVPITGRPLGLLLTCLLAGLLSASPHAAVNNGYTFSSTDYLAPAHQMDGWADTLDRHSRERSQLYRCKATDRCRGRLKSFDRIMSDTDTLSRDEKLQLAQYYINSGRYRDDRLQRLYDENGRKIGIRRSHWATLHDVLVKGGDCEDFATAKYFMLRELGYPADDLRVVVVYERKLRGHHAVLAARLEDGAVWLLDTDNRIRKRSHAGYRYIFAMNEHSVWDHEQKRSTLSTTSTGEAD